MDAGNAHLDLLARLFVADLEIEVSHDLVCLEQGGRRISVRPFVILDSSATRLRVLAVGEELAATVPTLRVDVFDPKSQTSPADLKFQCLEAFFRFAMIKLRRRTFLRPRVHVRGAERLSQAFGGYQRTLLRTVLLAAGARECIVHHADAPGCPIGRWADPGCRGGTSPTACWHRSRPGARLPPGR